MRQMKNREREEAMLGVSLLHHSYVQPNTDAAHKTGEYGYIAFRNPSKYNDVYSSYFI